MKPRALVVDDSLTVRMDLTEAFENAGFEVIPCSTLEESRAAMSGSSFALIVLDVLLPDGDGVSFLQELKANSGTAAVPVMLLSTEAQVRDRVHGLKTGADEYVGKPYDSGYVVARARELIRPRQPRSGVEDRATILVIDDSATFRNEMRAALEAAGYEVSTSSTGEDGLHSAVNQRPAAVIVDYGLPGIDGATVVRRMREDTVLRRTPCLLLTGSEDHSQEVRALEAGADGFVRKDEDLSVVLARLAAVLRSASAPSALDLASSVLGPKRVLAVDDSGTFLEELASQLRVGGYDVVLARSGEEALDLALVQSVDCILLDLVMPGISGNETCRRIKRSLTLRDIPLLMLTGVEDRQAMIEAINAGADDYIPKSSDFDVVRARVRAALRRKQFEDENRSVNEQLLRKEMEAAEALAQRELAEARAALLGELQKSKDRLDFALQAGGLGEWELDLKTHAMSRSPRHDEIFGYDSLLPEWSYETFLQHVLPECRTEIDANFKAALAGNSEWNVEAPVRCRDGGVRWIASQGKISAVQDGRPVAMVGVIMDITARKRAEQALIRSEKLASAGRMAATVAHEVNNPLAAVTNALFLIGTTPDLPPDLRQYLELADRELRRAAHMVKQTLGFYREVGTATIINPPEIADEVLHLFEAKLRNSMVRVERRYRCTTPIQAVEGEMRQMISNLIINSIDAMQSHGTLHLRTAGPMCIGQRPMVALTIADTGVGIAAEHRKQIFEPFFTTKKSFGTGLGLWVTSELVKKHDGRIRVRSQSGKGTVVTLWLPVERRSEERQTT